MKWIPVKEHLPEEFESVLVCFPVRGGRGWTEAQWDNMNEVWRAVGGDWTIGNVTDWMRIELPPTPPAAQEDRP